MALVEYGNCIIDVDLAKTKDYYSKYLSLEKNQVYMNYKKYCELAMTKEEKAFFDSFGIDPLCCQLETIGMTKEKSIPISTYFYVAGKYIKCNEDEVISIEELAENNFLDKREDSSIFIGLFQFDFQNPDAIFKIIPQDMPEGFICIQVWIECLPWLLNEKCEITMYYPPKWWQVFKRMKETKKSNLSKIEYINEIKSDLEADFLNNKINYHQLNQKEAGQLFRKWIKSFAPYIDKKKIKEYYIHGNKKYSHYLWHAFSYDVIPTELVLDAPLCYSNIKKKKCFILLNNERIAYFIENTENLDVSILNKYNDILIFDCDFTWTYCHTHEECCGPYFFDKKNPPPPYENNAIEIIKIDNNKYIEIFEKDGVYTNSVMQKCFDEDSYDGTKYFYWCPIDNKTSSFYDTKEKAIEEAKKLI